MPKEAHPCAVLRGHQGDVQALTFDHSETHLISGDAHGEVRVWNLGDLRPHSIRRLHPASAGIINLKLWRPAVDTAGNNTISNTINKPCSLLVTQGRDGTTHIWKIDDEFNIAEGPPVRSFVRDAFSFCRFSLLAAQRENDTTVAAVQSPEDFVDSVISGVDPPKQGIEMKEERSPETLARLLQNAISEIHTCSSPSSSLTSLDQKHQPDSNAAYPSALIAIPSYSEKVVEVCCAACCAPLAMFLQSESEAAAVPEQDRWGLCMATKLFVGPKEVNNEVLLAVGYESGHIVLWSVTAAVQESAAVAATIGTGASSTTPKWYSPPKPLASAKLHSEPIMALDINLDGYSGVSGSAEDALISFSISYTPSLVGAPDTRAAVTPTTTIDIRKQGVGDVELRPDGKLIASAGWDGKIRVYKASNGKALAVFKYHAASASAVAFSPRTFLIASGARDGTVALWDVYRTYMHSK